MARATYWYEIAGPTWLYRLSGPSGVVYIGVTNSPDVRMKKHRAREWWADVTRISLEWFPTRAAAFEAERKAIVAERPARNIARPKGA